MKIRHLFENKEQYLYRGITVKPSQTSPETITLNPDDKQFRKPKTSSVFFHNIVNALCCEKFGVYVRNLPFFYTDEKYTYYYGNVYRAKTNDSMTFYYADGVFDFTPHYRALRFDYRIFTESIFEANDTIKTDADFRDYFIKSIIDIGNTISLDNFKIKNISDVNRMYYDFGEMVFSKMLENGYEYEDDRDKVVTMIEKGFKLYLKRFYDYVELMTSTKNYNSIPDEVEIMVDADVIEMELIRI